MCALHRARQHLWVSLVPGETWAHLQPFQLSQAGVFKVPLVCAHTLNWPGFVPSGVILEILTSPSCLWRFIKGGGPGSVCLTSFLYIIVQTENNIWTADRGKQTTMFTARDYMGNAATPPAYQSTGKLWRTPHAQMAGDLGSWKIEVNM